LLMLRAAAAPDAAWDTDSDMGLLPMVCG